MELAVHASGDALAQGGLAYPGRSHEAKDGSVAPDLLLLGKLAHRKIFQDALLYILEAIVVLIQDPLGDGDVQDLRVSLSPGNIQKPVQIGPAHRGLGGAGLHALQALKLLEGLFLNPLGHALFLNPLPELLDLGEEVLPTPELLLDGLHLLPEVVLPLILVHLLLDPGGDLLVQLKALQIAKKQGQDLFKPFLDLRGFQDFLLFLEAPGGVVGYQVRQDGGVQGALDGFLLVAVQAQGFVVLQVAFKGLLHLVHQDPGEAWVLQGRLGQYFSHGP